MLIRRQAAWNTMREQGYGRIVNITSVNGLCAWRTLQALKPTQ